MTQSNPNPSPKSWLTGPAIPRVFLVILAALLAGALNYLLGQDAFWPVFTSILLAAGTSLVLDLAITKTLPGNPNLRITQSLATLAVAISVMMFFRVERNEAFEEVFAATPPPGVSHIDVEHLLTKETHKRLTIIQFEAPRDAIAALVAPKKFSENVLPKSTSSKQVKIQRLAWIKAFGNYGEILDSRWKLRLPVTDPIIYQWRGGERESIGETSSLLWDSTSGRAFAVHMAK